MRITNSAKALKAYTRFCRPEAWTYVSFSLKRMALRMLDGIDTQIDIEIGPVKVAWGRLLNIKYCSDWSVFEPGKVFV